MSAWSGAALQAALLQLLLVHHIALRLPLRNLWWAVAVVAAPTCVSVARYGDSAGSWNQQLGSQLVAIGVAALIGITVRTRRGYTEALEDRARRLETERDQQVRLAAAAERARIAREMHDIIGHNLSVITGLADGGRYAAAKSPDRAAQALDAIGTTSRQALGELRRLLDVLRDDDQDGTGPEPELAPQPALTDLDRLLDGVRRAGLPVRTTVKGARPPRGPPAHPLPRHPGSPHQHPQTRRSRRHRPHRAVLRVGRRRHPHRHRHGPDGPAPLPHAVRRPRPAGDA